MASVPALCLQGGSGNSIVRSGKTPWLSGVLQASLLAQVSILSHDEKSGPEAMRFDPELFNLL